MMDQTPLNAVHQVGIVLARMATLVASAAVIASQGIIHSDHIAMVSFVHTNYLDSFIKCQLNFKHSR